MTDPQPEPSADIPAHRYNAALANAIEAKWHARWEEERTFWTPNPSGLLSDVNAERRDTTSRA